MANKSTNTQMDEYSVAENCVRKLLKFIGEDPESEHLCKTPSRVVKSYAELFSGYSKTPIDALGTTFHADGYDQMVVLRGIEAYSTCAHHMIPFFGTVDVGYVPGKRIVGLSKLARLVEVFARRLQVQERLTEQVAASIMEILEPKGVMVVMRARHLCMCARGVGKQHAQMVTSSIKGCFSKESARSEFLNLTREI
jgi:GTP cyclohydrolase I